MGGAWGSVAGLLAQRRKRRTLVAVVLAVMGPLGGAAISVWRFYSSPMIFAFDPFVGYFSGTLYDTVVEPGPALLSYRAGSVALVIALLCLASALDVGPGSLRLQRVRDRSFWVRLGIAGALLLAWAVEWACGSQLGHSNT